MEDLVRKYELLRPTQRISHIIDFDDTRHKVTDKIGGEDTATIAEILWLEIGHVGPFHRPGCKLSSSSIKCPLSFPSKRPGAWRRLIL